MSFPSPSKKQKKVDESDNDCSNNVSSSSSSSILLSHLPLRPSTMEIVKQAGFATISEIISAKENGGGLSNLMVELNVPTIQQAHTIYQEIISFVNNNKSNNTNSKSAIELLQRNQYNNNNENNNNNSTSGGGATCIVTFCRAIDQMMHGGIALGELTEIVSGPGCGKTSLATQIAIDTALPSYVGGVQGQTIYIDTEGSFSSERCYTIANELIQHVQNGLKLRATTTRQQNTWNNIQPEHILQGIHVFRVHTVTDLITVLYGPVPEMIINHNNNNNIKCLIIDSIAFPFRAVSTDTTKSIHRTKQLTNIASHLSTLAYQYNIAVITLNQMTTKVINIDNNNNNNNMQQQQQQQQKLVPALGESWAHAITTRLILNYNNNQNNNNNIRTCSLVKSPKYPPGNAEFIIVERGIRDIDYKNNNNKRNNNNYYKR